MKELSPAGAEFVKSRSNDSRDNPVADRSELANGSIFYFTCIDSAEKLHPLYERFKDRFRCVYSKDIYTGEQWLEIMPGGATKANAALRLKEMLGCEKLVAFGDSQNDMDLFTAADECYAVANAVPELKRKGNGCYRRKQRGRRCKISFAAVYRISRTTKPNCTNKNKAERQILSAYF